MTAGRAPRHRRAAGRRLTGLGLALSLLLVAGGGGSTVPSASGAETTQPAESGTTAPSTDAAFPVTIDHKFGSAEIPERPERVVSVGFTDQDYLLALGVTPVGVREWFGEKPSATWPWATDELGDAEPAVLTRELDFEQVPALEPDLIIGLYSGMTEEEYGLLVEIAPTVAQSDEFADFAIPWQEQTLITGRALGLEGEAEDLVTEVEELTDNDNGYVLVSAERLELVDVDLLVWFEAANDPGPADLLANPLYQGLDVVTEGRDLYLGYDLYAGALSLSSILSLPFVLDELVPEFAAAVDGDPETDAELGA